MQGEPAWFDASSSKDSWTLSVTDFKIDSFDDVHNTGGTVLFQTGYPYISLPASPYRLFVSTLEKYYPNFACDRLPDYSVCRIRNVKCSEIDIPSKITITVENYDFTIPINNLLVDIEHNNKEYCQAQIAESSNKQDWILGDAFFTQFTGIFDIEKDKIGLATNVAHSEGSTMECAYNCSTIVLLEVGAIFSVAVAALALILLCERMRKQNRQMVREKEEERLLARKEKGLRGYDIDDEREEDDELSDEEEKDVGLN